ncbi:hypothetical protein ACFYO5_10860 [Streptomyces sp. NPDC006259]|uniref:hypothetical protein n=1 Tax=Streptomyces sp. NPDC006259 TaxID=3364740 RepID=UPI0036CA35B0
MAGEFRNISIHGEAAQIYGNGDVRTAAEIADVVNASRPTPFTVRRAARRAR